LDDGFRKDRIQNGTSDNSRDKSLLKQYVAKVDINSTSRQFTDVKSFSKFVKRLPYVGIAFSIGTK